MRTYALWFSLFAFLLVLGGCNSGSVMRNATGFPYEIVVTMNKADWDGTAGQAIKSELTSDVPGLPQSEPAFKITYAMPDHFDGLLTYVRNILIVKVDNSMYTKVSISSEKDRWAKNQEVLTMTAPSTADIVDYIKQNPRTLVEYFNKAERTRSIARLKKEHSQVVKGLDRKSVV